MIAASRAAPIPLALAAALLHGLSQSVWAEPALLPVHPTAPADGAAVEAGGVSPAVRLTWNVPPEPVPVRFFVEVVAIEPSGLREVFAGYVDHPPADVALSPQKAEYAWRVYTVGRDIPAYTLSGWQRFSFQEK